MLHYDVDKETGWRIFCGIIVVCEKSSSPVRSILVSCYLVSINVYLYWERHATQGDTQFVRTQRDVIPPKTWYNRMACFVTYLLIHLNEQRRQHACRRIMRTTTSRLLFPVTGQGVLGCNIFGCTVLWCGPTQWQLEFLDNNNWDSWLKWVHRVNWNRS